MKIRLESKIPDINKVVGKATFKLDNEDKDTGYSFSDLTPIE